MNPNFRSLSTDGYGDRDDIALARSVAEGTIIENQAKDRAKISQAVDAAREYGSALEAENISEVVRKMIESECWSKLFLKSQIIWDVETVSEAITEACIVLGLGDEEYAPSVHDQGNEIEISLV